MVDDRQQTAVAHFAQKYGRQPVLVQANAKDVGDAPGVTVESSQYVLPGHLFVVAER